MKKENLILLINLYTIIESTPNKISVKFANKDHSVFKAHFPNNPILPGFLQIDTILHILDEKMISLQYSKFLKHIYPDDIVVYNIEKKGKQTTVKILKDDIRISEIRYECQ